MVRDKSGLVRVRVRVRDNVRFKVKVEIKVEVKVISVRVMSCDNGREVRVRIGVRNRGGEGGMGHKTRTILDKRQKTKVRKTTQKT